MSYAFFYRLSNFWYRNGFEILVLTSIVIIVIAALFRIGKKGTWSSASFIERADDDLYYPAGSKGDSKGETETRRVLQSLFKKPFIKARPDFLRNTVTGDAFNLELDCYNDQMKLAVEYNGAQHYRYIPHFHKNKEAFLNQRYRDFMKRTLCEKNGIRLIEIPYTIQIPDIRNFLLRRLHYI